MKISITVLLLISSSAAYASDMAGIGLFISLILTGVCLLVSTIIALMSTTSRGYKYIISFVVAGLLIAIFMGDHDWKLQDDIEMYRIHLLETLVLIVPPLILKFKLKKRENA